GVFAKLDEVRLQDLELEAQLALYGDLVLRAQLAEETVVALQHAGDFALHVLRVFGHRIFIGGELDLFADLRDRRRDLRHGRLRLFIHRHRSCELSARASLSKPHRAARAHGERTVESTSSRISAASTLKSPLPAGFCVLGSSAPPSA